MPEIAGRVLRFDETGVDGFHRSWIMFFPVGHYEHESYGELDFTRAKLARIKTLFDNRVRKIDVALDADHRAAHAEDSRATGWVEALELREAQPDGTPAGLWGRIKWTPYGMTFLKSDEYRYFSPEFGSWTDPQSGETFDDVLLGGGLTNRPFLKTLPPIALSERRRTAGTTAERRRRHGGVEAGGGMTVKGGRARSAEEIAEMERELAELRLLAEKKGSKKPAPGADDEDESGADDEDDADDEQLYDEDEALDDSEEMSDKECDEADGDGADDDEDEEPAPRKKRKLSEGGVNLMTLAEQQRLQKALAEANFKLYEGEIERTLASWRSGSFLFKENAKGAAKKGRIALSRSFMESYRSFMRTEGVALSEGQRRKLNAMLQLALSTGQVDLSQRGGSYDPDGRLKPTPRMIGGAEDALQKTAERIALDEHQTADMLTLDDATRLDIYTRAARMVEYN